MKFYNVFDIKNKNGTTSHYAFGSDGSFVNGFTHNGMTNVVVNEKKNNQKSNSNISVVGIVITFLVLLLLSALGNL